MNKIATFIADRIYYQYFGYLIFYCIEFFSRKNNQRILISIPKGRTYSDNARYFFEYLLYNDTPFEYKLLVKRKNVYNTLLRKHSGKILYAYSFEAFKYFITSKYLFFCNSKHDFYPFYPVGRNGKVYINLWHGTPLKKVGYLYNKDSKHYGYETFFNILITSSEFTKYLMASQFKMHVDDIWVMGQPRNDILFSASQYKLPPSIDYLRDKTVILYAPTFREMTKLKLFPFNDFNSEGLIRYLEMNDIYLIIRMHIFDFEKKNFEENIFENKRLILCNSDVLPCVYPLLKITSILITDYSSIFFDFLLLERPIIFLPYDYEHYSQIRGFNMDYFSNTPGYKPKTFKEFLGCISKYINNPKHHSSERNLIKNKFNKYNDNLSSKRLLEKLTQNIL